jgi:hypothetical protein
MPRRSRPTPPPIDREKLRAWVRRFGDEYAFYLLDEAIEVMTPEQLAFVTAKYVRPEELRPDAVAAKATALIEDVRQFDARARKGVYYEQFRVNSRNCTQKSGGTRAFISDFGRILDRCVAASDKADRAATADAFAVLFDLLRHIDECCDDVVFFADEAGAWQIPVDWRAVFPAWFRCLTEVAAPDEYARLVVQAIEDFEHYHWDETIEEALEAATAAQRAALSDRAAMPRRRR